MEHKDIWEQLPGVLLPWYHNNKRQLPWREDRDPYHIWVSEIMLQQTRVEAVKGYYTRFLQTFPTIEELAKADDELLYKMWEGLGYYSRVRNLKKAAQQIMTQHKGIFPREYSEILKLSGIGEYTAGAISSIAFDLPVPAVDGNVLRVASRLLNDFQPVDTPAFKKMIQAALARIYPAKAGDFTQALMELGATLCGPNRKPDCGNCPCNRFCKAYLEGTGEQLPVKTPKKQRRVEKRTVFLLRCRDRYALEKRPERGLLAGLWQLPNASGQLNTDEIIAWVEEKGLKPKEILLQVERKHIFTHIEWHMIGALVEVSEEIRDFQWRTVEQMDKETALPTAFRQFFNGL